MGEMEKKASGEAMSTLILSILHYIKMPSMATLL